MNETTMSLGATIDGIAKVLAEWTIERQGDRSPDLAERFGPHWRTIWSTDTQVRVRSLGQAVALEEPALFVEMTRWDSIAMTARDVRVDDLRANLACLREVLGEALPRVGVEAAVAIVDEAIARLDDTVPPPPAAFEGSPRRTLVLRYLEALLDGRRPEAERLVLDEVRNGTPVAGLYRTVLIPAQAELGRMWRLNEISVADEHYASATTLAIMARLRDHFPPVTPREKTVVAAAVPGDLHEIGLRMVSDFLEMDGWTVVYLGPNVPAQDIADSVASRGADLLALSASTGLHVRSVAEVIAAVRSRENQDSRRRAPVIVGGPPFNAIPDLWSKVGADASATTGEDAVAQARALVANT